MVSRPFRPHLRIISQTQAAGLGFGITAPWAGVAPTSARVTNLRDDGGETLSSLFDRPFRPKTLVFPKPRALPWAYLGPLGLLPRLFATFSRGTWLRAPALQHENSDRILETAGPSWRNSEMRRHKVWALCAVCFVVGTGVGLWAKGSSGGGISVMRGKDAKEAGRAALIEAEKLA